MGAEMVESQQGDEDTRGRDESQDALTSELGQKEEPARACPEGES